MSIEPKAQSAAPVSPYLQRPLRSFEEALAERQKARVANQPFPAPIRDEDWDERPQGSLRAAG